jgi:hypothetical protein
MSHESTEGPFQKRDYNPHSPNAMFATILTRLEMQDKNLEKILNHAEKTNGRVSSLEHWRTTMKAKLAVVAAGVSAAVAGVAWLADYLAK